MEVNLTIRTTKMDEVAKLITVLQSIAGIAVSVALEEPAKPSTNGVSITAKSPEQAKELTEVNLDLIRQKVSTIIQKDKEVPGLRNKIKVEMDRIGAKDVPSMKKESYPEFNLFLDKILQSL